MTYKVKLKNSEEFVLMDDYVFDFFQTDDYFKGMAFLDSLRLHSSGCVVFQKTWRKTDGSYKTETIYVHKYIAEKYLREQRAVSDNLVSAKNNNKLDCRLENLYWRSRSLASRQRKSSSKVGYTGVYQEKTKFRAVISVNQKTIHIGMFDSPEEAALAYNKMSRDLYGDLGKQNKIKTTLLAKKNN